MAKSAMAARSAAKDTATVLLDEYRTVRLSHPVQAGGVTYPAGSRGVIVHRHADGIGYEVEFDEPAFRVITSTEVFLSPCPAPTKAPT